MGDVTLMYAHFAENCILEKRKPHICDWALLIFFYFLTVSLNVVPKV